MGLADEIINGTYQYTSQKKKKKKNVADEIINGNYQYKAEKTRQEQQEQEKQVVHQLLKGVGNNFNPIEKTGEVVSTALDKGNDLINYFASGKAQKDATQAAKNTGKFLTDMDYREKVGLDTLLSVGTGLNIAAKTVSSQVESGAKFLYNESTKATNWLNNQLGLMSDEQYQKAEQFRKDFMKENTTEKIWKNVFGWNDEVNDFVKKNSFITEDNFGGQTVQGLTQLMTTAAFAQTPMGWELPTFISSAGGAEQKAYQLGANDTQALAVGLFGGTLEVLTEKLGSGVVKVKGTGWKSFERLEDDLTNKISNNVVRYLAQTGVSAMNEGMEEVISGYGNAIAEKLTYMSDKDLKELYSSKDAFQDFMMAAWTSLLAGGARAATPSGGQQLREDIRSGRSQITGFTQNEQNIIDSEVAQRIQEAKEKGQKVKTGEIVEQVQEDLRNGDLSAESIQRGINGEKYQTFAENETKLKETQSQLEEVEKNLKDNYSSKVSKLNPEYEQLLQQQKDLSEQINVLKNNQQALGRESYLEARELSQNDALAQRSLYEYEQGGRHFEYELDDNASDRTKGLYESAAQNGNNTTKFRNFVKGLDTLQNSTDKSYQYRFTNTEELREKGLLGKVNYDVQEGDTLESIAKKHNMSVDELKSINKNLDLTPGNQIKVYAMSNGLKAGNTIYLNIDTNDSLETVLGHEVTHLLEGTDDYKTLRDLLYKQAKKNGIYDTKRAELEDLYSAENADIDSELTAELAKELFTDENFVNELTTKPTTFKKVLNFIDDLITKFTGSSEEVELRKIKKQFQEAFNNMKSYDESNKVQHSLGEQVAPFNNVQYSLNKDSKGRELSKEQQEFFKDSKVRDNEGRLLEVYHGSKARDVNIFEYSPERQTGTDYGEAYYFTSDYNKAKGYQYDSNLDERVANHEAEHQRRMDKLREANFSEEARKEFLEWSEQNKIQDILNDEDYIIENVDNISGETKKVYLNLTNPLIVDANGEYYYKVYPSYFEEAREKGNDGIIVKNVIDNPRGEARPIDTYIAFKNNQIKNIDNTNPTTNEDIRYSLSESGQTTDSNGKNLSVQQLEYFKDSKVLDNEGRLLEVYHGTPNPGFTVFDTNRSSSNTMSGEYGLYFTDSKQFADDFSYERLESDSMFYDKKGKKGDIYSNYLNITNPLDFANLTQEQIEDLYNYASNMGQLDGKDAFVKNMLRWQEIGNHQLMKGNLDIKAIADNSPYDGIKAKLSVQGNENEYIVFNSNQIKNVDNKNPTDNPDIRYSISKQGKLQENGKDVALETSNTGTTGSLMAIHNLGEGKMNGLLDLNGIPVPSIAITNPSIVDHNQFGDGSLIFDKETINPANRLNEVYDRDVWTSTMGDNVRIDYNIKTEDLWGIEKNIYNDYKDDIVSSGLNRFFDADNLDSKIKSMGIEGTIEDAKQSPELMYIYEKTVNPNYQPVIKQKNFNNKYSNEILQNFLDNYTGTEALNELRITDEIREQIREATKPYYDSEMQKFLEKLKPEQRETGRKLMQETYDADIEKSQNISDFLLSAYRLQQEGLDTQTMDKYATLDKVKEDVNKVEFEQWIDNTLGNLLRNAEKGIYNGKDYLTNNGRRTFKQLHNPYTLENIVKALTKGNTKGSQHTIANGFGKVQANMGNQFKSIADIREAQNQLMTSEQANESIKELKEAIDQDISDLADTLDGDFFNMDNASTLIQEYASKKNRNELVFRKLASDYANHGIPSELIDRITNDLNQLQTIPTDYFEAKPQRAVGLDEIQMAVIPNTWSAETKQRLQDMGIEYTEYDPTIEGDRNRVINQFDELKWSMNKNNIAPIRQRGLTYDVGVRQEQSPDYIDIAPINERIDEARQLRLDYDSEVKALEELDNTIGLDKADSDRLEYLKSLTQTTNESTGQEYTNEYSPFEKAKKNLAENKVKRFIEKETYKAIDKAAKVAAQYGEFNRKEKTNLRNEFKRFGNLTSEQLTNPNTYNEFKDIIRQYADREMNFTDYHLKEVKDDIRKRKINVSDIRNQITDFNDYRRQYFGRLNLTNEGMTIDQHYQELSELYPEYFSKDITTEADMLNQLMDFMDLDTTITERYRLSDDEIDRITSKAFSTLVTESPTEQQIQEYEEEINRSVERKRSEVRRQQLLDEMGLTIDDISVGKDINALGYQRTDPIRLNEKVFGYEVGKKINDATIRQTIHNTAEKMRWQNQERSEIEDLGIKARSKESAAVQKYGEGEYVNDLGELVKYGDKELASEFPNIDTQNKIKRAAEVLRGKYDIYIDQINDVLTDLGYDAIPKRKNYFRHFIELNDKFSQWGTPFNRQTMQEQDLPTDINGLTDQFKPGKQYFASALQRKGIKTTYDAITGIDGYIETAGNLIFHTEDIQRYRALSKLIRETYGQQHGLDNIDIMTEAEKNQRVEDVYGNKLTKYAAWLDEQANALAGKKAGIDRAVERMLGRKVYTAASTLKSQVGSNMTGFNVRSAMTNFASVVQGASKTSKIALLKGTVSTIQNMIHDDGMTQKSDFLTGRYGTNQLSQKAWQKIANAGQIFMEASDHFTSNQIWRSKYYELLDRGMSETEAIREADDFAARVMGNRVQGATAEIFNSKTLGFLTQFQLEVNNQWSNMIHDNKMDIQSGKKGAASVVFQLGQLYGLSYMFNTIMKGLTGSDVMFDPIDLLMKLFNPDDDDDKTTEERARDVLGDIVNQLPMASIFTGGRIPIQEAFSGVSTGFKYLTGQENEYGQKYTAGDVFDDSLESLAYLLLPTGYGQLRKTYKGTIDTDYDVNLNPFKGEIGITERPIRGSYTDSGNLRFTADNDIPGRIRSALFGQYANSEAQDYINSGYQTINAKKIPELQEFGMTSSEYKKWQKEYSEATATTEEINGIKYTKYKDSDGNIYLYDKNTRTLLDSNGNESNKNVTTMTKVDKKELVYDYIKNSDFTPEQKEYLFDENFDNTTTDKYGYEKYTERTTDKKGKPVTKTYWYDSDTNTLYDSKYKVSNKNINSLTKVSSDKSVEGYNSFDTYEEFDYSYKNPDKYKLIQDTGSYKKYKTNETYQKAVDWAYNTPSNYSMSKALDGIENTYTYLDKLNDIKGDKDKKGKTISGSRKKKVFNYINSLNLTPVQKAMLVRTQYSSYDNYNNEIVNYLNNQTSITLDEEYEILKKLGYKVKGDRVSW